MIVVGAGLAGLVAAAEAAEAGRRVLLLDQEPEQSLGGQAWWSFGGLFFVGSAEQRRLRVHDSVDLAWQDWLGTAGFDRPEDEWPRQWARAYVEWAAGEKQAWLAVHGALRHPDRRLGRARRLPRQRPRQQRAAVPRHLGHRARGRRAVRAAGQGGGRHGAASRSSSGTGSTRSPSPAARWTACPAPSSSRATRPRGDAVVAGGRRRVLVPRPGGHRHLRRDRRQPRPRPRGVAAAARRAARATCSPACPRTSTGG